MLVRTPVSDVSAMGRNTQGVKLVNLKANDRLVGLEIVSESDLEQYAARSGEEGLAGDAPEEAAADTADGGEPEDVQPEDNTEEKA